jgi:hypothetical protein
MLYVKTYEGLQVSVLSDWQGSVLFLKSFKIDLIYMFIDLLFSTHCIKNV